VEIKSRPWLAIIALVLPWLGLLAIWLGKVPFPLLAIPVTAVCVVALAASAGSLLLGERPLWLALVSIFLTALIMIPALIYLTVGLAFFADYV